MFAAVHLQPSEALPSDRVATIAAEASSIHTHIKAPFRLHPFSSFRVDFKISPRQRRPGVLIFKVWGRGNSAARCLNVSVTMHCENPHHDTSVPLPSGRWYRRFSCRVQSAPSCWGQSFPPNSWFSLWVIIVDDFEFLNVSPGTVHTSVASVYCWMWPQPWAKPSSLQQWLQQNHNHNISLVTVTIRPHFFPPLRAHHVDR